MCHCNGILKIKYSYLSVRGEQNREKFHLVSLLHEVILWENGPFFFILFLWEFTSHRPRTISISSQYASFYVEKEMIP